MDSPVGPPVPSHLDVVYPVRRARLNESLRFSLRSLANLPHRGVWLFGDAPAWVGGVEHAKIPQNRTKWENTTPALLEAARSPGISDPFLWFNDDFYVLEPVTEVPTFHHGPLADHARRYRDTHPNSPYAKDLAQTAEFLVRQGVEVPLSYELHVPLVVWKVPLLAALDARIPKYAHPAKRSVYGNLAQIGGEYLREDVKGPGIPSGPFVSTGRVSWCGPIGNMVRQAFPEASPYERIGSGGPDPRSWTPPSRRPATREPRVRLARRPRPVPCEPGR